MCMNVGMPGMAKGLIPPPSPWVIGLNFKRSKDLLNILEDEIIEKSSLTFFNQLNFSVLCKNISIKNFQQLAWKSKLHILFSVQSVLDF